MDVSLFSSLTTFESFNRSNPPPLCFECIIDHLNINSIRQKFVLIDTIVEAFEIFLTSESKLDNTFPFKKFHVAGLIQYRQN